MYLYKCPECGHETNVNLRHDSFPCGPCNHPTFKGIYMNCENDQEPVEEETEHLDISEEKFDKCRALIGKLIHERAAYVFASKDYETFAARSADLIGSQLPKAIYEAGWSLQKFTGYCANRMLQDVWNA